MLNYEPELTWLRDNNLLPREKADALMARERREIFSVQPEVRLVAWMGVMLLVTGAGIWVSQNLQRIGPMTIALVLLLVSLGCYSFVAWRRGRQTTTMIDDFVVLLGALLISVNLAWIESQFKLLEQGWPRHLLILAVFHAIAAYFFDSRSVLTLALTAFAGWLGVEMRGAANQVEPLELAARAFIAAALILGWRSLHIRWGEKTSFVRVFEHFAANLGFLGALALTAADDIYVLGAIVTAGIAAVVMRHGFKTRTEAFVVYAYIYTAVAFGIVVGRVIGEPALAYLFSMIYTTAAIVGLFIIHARFRRGE